MNIHRLTADAQAARSAFQDMGGCSCHINPPCSYCTHEGHPEHQENTPECWRPIASLDVESTGPDPAKDRIISLDIVKYFQDGRREHKGWLFNPGCPIPKEASEVHKITDEMVKDKPMISEGALREVASFLHGCDLLGYNLFRFDIPILLEESARINVAGIFVFPAPDAVIFDPSIIFRKKEERTLSAAVLKYCNRVHDGAHNSQADAEATIAVLLGQLNAYDDLAKMTPEQLAEYSSPENMVDFAGKLGRDADGDVIYNIGKCKGVKVKNDPGFGYWMLSKDFTFDTKSKLRAELERTGNL